jgi:hypothetical protein
MAYPKKEGYAKAELAFDKALSDGTSVGTIVAGARHYATAKAGIDSKWLMMPARWLSERCWRESPQAPVSKRSKPPAPSPAKAKPNLRRVPKPPVKREAAPPKRATGMPDFIQLGGKVWDSGGDAGHVVGFDSHMVAVDWDRIGRASAHYKTLLPSPPNLGADKPKPPWSTPVLKRLIETEDGLPSWLASQTSVTEGDFG